MKNSGPEKTMEENNQLEFDEEMMREALALAREAELAGDVPAGAVIAKDNVIIGRGKNTREVDQSPVRHAEINAMEDAAFNLGSWRLIDCTLYVTKEPCVMCSGALVLSRIKRVVYGIRDEKGGCCESVYSLPQDKRFNHRVEVQSGVLEKECLSLIKEFFRKKRRINKNIKKSIEKY